MNPRSAEHSFNHPLPQVVLTRQQFSYFQFRRLPSASHSSVVAKRLFLVASVFASVIHSMYSFLQLYGKFSKVAFAFLFFLRAAVRSSGTTSSFLGAAGFFWILTPLSLSFAACLTRSMITLSAGRSASDVMRPKLPIEVFWAANASASSRDCFQKP